MNLLSLPDVLLADNVLSLLSCKELLLVSRTCKPLHRVVFEVYSWKNLDAFIRTRKNITQLSAFLQRIVRKKDLRSIEFTLDAEFLAADCIWPLVPVPSVTDLSISVTKAYFFSMDFVSLAEFFRLFANVKRFELSGRWVYPGFNTLTKKCPWNLEAFTWFKPDGSWQPDDEVEGFLGNSTAVSSFSLSLEKPKLIAKYAHSITHLEVYFNRGRIPVVPFDELVHLTSLDLVWVTFPNRVFDSVTKLCYCFPGDKRTGKQMIDYVIPGFPNLRSLTIFHSMRRYSFSDEEGGRLAVLPLHTLKMEGGSGFTGRFLLGNAFPGLRRVEFRNCSDISRDVLGRVKRESDSLKKRMIHVYPRQFSDDRHYVV